MAPILHTPLTRPMSQNQKNPNINRMSPTEMKVRRDKGLYYWCHDKFSFTHKCPNRQLMLLQYDDTGEDQLLKTMHKPPNIPAENPETNQTEHHLFFNAMKGTSNIGVLRFSGSIGHIQVQIIIDGGSSASFLQPRIAKFLKLHVKPAPIFKVLVGNGKIMTIEGLIKNLTIEVQGHKLEVSIFLLPVA